VYASFGLELSGAAADAMRALAGRLPDGAVPGGSPPAHRYTLADFGLRSEEVDAIVVGALRIPGLDGGGHPAGLDVVDVTGDAHLRGE
jgi:hypothetical protein